MTICENCGRSLHESELYSIKRERTAKKMEVCEDCTEIIFHARNDD